MKSDIRRGAAIILALIGLLLLIKLFDILVAPNHAYPGRVASFAWPELGAVAFAGLLAALLAPRTELVRLGPPERPGPALLSALLVGAVLGAALALLDAWLRIGDISVGLPLAPLFYLWGGISQEILTHLAPTALIVGLVSFVRPSLKAQTVTFWITALAMSAFAAYAMAAAFSNPAIPLTPQLTAAPILIAAAVFLVELALFWMLWKQGFLAALAMRLGFYAIWHIAWPALTY